jgi:single-strand DNA-binding protein
MINETTFVGRLTRDPEVKVLSNTSITNFALALDESYKGKDGEWVKKTLFVECQIWNGSGKNFKDRCSKGDLVYVKGKYDPNSWETEEGEKRTTPRFTIYTWKSLTFGKTKKDDETTEEVVEDKPKAKKGRPAKKQEVETVVENGEDEDDSIPF